MSHAPIACSLTARELACGAADLLPGLAEEAESVRPMPGGIRLEFAAGEGIVPRLAAVIERERHCCQFLRFRLEVAPALGPIALEIDGPPGTAEFLAGLHRSFAPPAVQERVEASEDGASGYEEIATTYIATRGTRPEVGDAIGAAIVRDWAQAFPPGATVLDLGAGSGEPSTRILQEAGLASYAVDASTTMVAAFRERFPGVPIERNAVEASTFFDRTFDGVLAWGLLFLLEPAAQALVIEKVARALAPGGRFLFTAPRQPLEWSDAMTGRRSQSLGAQTYERLLREAGLTRVAEAQDEGGNHYYFVEKRKPDRVVGR